jgi:hypothetical protein
MRKRNTSLLLYAPIVPYRQLKQERTRGLRNCGHDDIADKVESAEQLSLGCMLPVTKLSYLRYAY